jgi:hypothetical protein
VQNLHNTGVGEYFIDTFLGFIIFFSDYSSICFSWFLYFYFFQRKLRYLMGRAFAPQREEEEPPSAEGHDSRREFTDRQVYKRVWVGGRNMTVMAGETTWAPIARMVGNGTLCRASARGRHARVYDTCPVVRVGRRGRLVGAVILCELQAVGARSPMEGAVAEGCMRHCAQVRAVVGVAPAKRKKDHAVLNHTTSPVATHRHIC